VTSADLVAALASQELASARRRVFRQLLESLTYEGAIRPETDPGPDGGLACRLRGETADGVPVVYRWRAERRFSFARLRLGPEPVVRSVNGHSAEAMSPRAFLTEIGPALSADPERRERFAGELEHTVLNDVLARHHWRRLGRGAGGAGYDELESLVIDGHPYHPSYKSRIGFDPVDNVAFGPEFANLVRPLWVALHRDMARRTAAPGVDAEAFLRRDLGPEAYTGFRSVLAEAGHRPDQYRLLPVHPWQWREQVVGALFPLLSDGALVPVGTAPDDYRAQQSLRTLANATRPERASLKLSLSIVNTSTARTLAPHTVANAPLITGWLQHLAGSDPYLSGELRPVLLGEVLGVAYGGQPAGMLSAIWRESLHPYLEAGEGAAPFTALCHVDAGGEPFIARWVKDQGAEPWTRRLLEVSVLPVLHFLAAHGIALEAHAQNLILIHEDGRPRRLALRDFHDGIRFSAARLADPAARPALHSTPASHLRVNRNSYLEAETAEEVRDFVHDAFFFVNLAELAMFLEDRFGLAERRFWSIARGVVEAYQRRFPPARGHADGFDLLVPTVSVEQLTTRRLLPDTSLRVHEVPNPLAQVTSA
jgi:2-[(L-alanin-3-ylcarbamoyl)methyl]-3-(2-aminoethylcarbamoyl)-2-hydroxypropanoate synthase